MTNLLKPLAVVAVGCLSFGTLCSCSEESKKQAAAESAGETSVEAIEDYAKILESIKDEESAKKAIEKLDGVAEKFVKIAEKTKRAQGAQLSPEETAKLQEKAKPAAERLMKATTAAMPILASKPELMQAFQAKSMAIAGKMQAAMQ